MKGVSCCLAALTFLALPVRSSVAEGAGDIEIGGLIDVGFTHNFNDPTSAQNEDTGNVVRGYLNREDTFQINLAQLHVSKSPEPVGFDLKLAFGQTARGDEGSVGTNIDGSGTNPDDDIAIQQAYVAYKADVGNGLTIKAGKFVTLLVRDVIESNNNWFNSYAYEFFLVPFTHLGIRLEYPIFDGSGVVLGVNNGHDADLDDNKSKTIEGMLFYNPTELWHIEAKFNYGAEAAANEGDKFFIISLVTTYNLSEDLSTFFSFVYGRLEDGLGEGANGHFWSPSIGALYKFNDKFGIAGRFEYLSDETRSFQNGGVGARNLWAPTITGHYYVTENLEFRLEFRHDEATGSGADAIFNKEGGTDDSQNTLAAQLLYAF